MGRFLLHYFCMPRIAGSVIGIMVLVVVGWDAQSPAATLLPEKLPENTVAVVSDVPVSLGRITRAELKRSMVQRAATAGLDSIPKPGGEPYAELERFAFGELLDGVWIRGQASEMGIFVTPRQVVRERARLIRQAFKSKAGYHEFLEESHLTQRDVFERVELQLISTAIQRRIMRGADGESEMQEAFSEFVKAYGERWRARTVCAPELATDRCSNGPPPVAEWPVR